MIQRASGQLPPFREVAFGKVDIERQDRADGSVLLRSRVPLGEYPRTQTDRLRFWAERTPDAPFLARREGTGPFRFVTYAEAWATIERIGQALLDRGLSVERPIAVLSENSIEHALLALAAMHVGVLFSPISPAYARLSTDFGKLGHVLGTLQPALVVVSDGPIYERAVSAALPADVEVVTTGRALAHRRSTPFAALAATPTPAVAVAHAAIVPERIAKILFTSGSTGTPKGVLNTHRMLCSNVQQIVQAFPCMSEEPLTLLDWLPWHHTFGGNHNFGLVLETGGTLYIDDGNPTPQGIATTVANLREIAPRVYFNVPKGFVELLPHLERDAELRRNFFSRLGLIFYAGAGLSQPVWDGLQRLAVETTGSRVVITSGIGCTESSPAALFANFAETSSGVIGVPVAGLTVKLAPVGDKLEARFRGPNVTPGYFRRPEETRAAFDEEGFFRTGDALQFVDAADPGRGLRFDGRIAEDFKLNSGTWVSLGALRAAVLDACGSLVADAVLTGLDRDFVGAILFPSIPACAALAELPADTAAATIVAHARVRDRIRRGLLALASRSTGSASRVARAVLTTTPPSLDHGEITDKGSLNQRAVLDRRAALVDAIHHEAPSDEVIVVAT